jgi:Xaa-Pro aminopeptidase
MVDMIKTNQIQSYLENEMIDGWLLYDFRGSNPYFWKIVGNKPSTTRQCFLFIPRTGDPQLIVHLIDKLLFSRFSDVILEFQSLAEQRAILSSVLENMETIAMEYSSNCMIPYVSRVDGGMLEYIRKLGITITSSADLFQYSFARWTPKEHQSHIRAAMKISRIKDEAFNLIRDHIDHKQPVSELDVQQFILDQFRRANMITDGSPVVAVNGNAGAPHYQPTPEVNTLIKPGDLVLIDLWAKEKGDNTIFADITWMGYVGKRIPSKYRQIFNVVKSGRECALEALHHASNNSQSLEGWQVDQKVRDVIARAGYGQYFIHRTGHSLSPGPAVHGMGVNIDNFESHDTRKIVSNLGFSIEPGIYTTEFGVRSEINVFIEEDGVPMVTTPIQDAIIKL